MSILGQEPVTLRRYPASTVIDFRVVKGTPTDSTIQMSVQPLSGEDITRLVEGERADDIRKGYTETPVRTVDEALGTPADEVIFLGETFKVDQVQHWRAVIPHYKAKLVRLQR